MIKENLKWIMGVSLLILSLPILINILLRIDWFSEDVMGGENGWLSFYGSYLGGILGGVLTLVGVIVTIMYQDRLRNQESVEKQKVGVKILDNLIDEFYLSMTLIFKVLNTEDIPDYTLRESIKIKSIPLNNFYENLNDIPWDIVPHKYIQEYLTIKTKIKYIKELFESKDLNSNLNRIEIVDLIKEKNIKDSLETIIKSHSKFKESSDQLEELEKAIKEGGY